MGAQIGDLIQVETKKGKEEGILMPCPEEGVLIIKLKSGYNLGFKKEEIKNIKVLEKKEGGGLNVRIKKAEETTEEKKISPLPTISLLHCGGTIASKIDYATGAVSAKFSPAEIKEMFPDIFQKVNLRSRLIANMMSDDMRFGHYNIIAKAIKEEIEAGTEGVIITHGTDTLHYTSAALSFALENLSIPVLLVGSQRSSDRGSSDAFLNLKCAVNFILNSDFGEVALCMHENSQDESCLILPALKSRKLHTSRRDAFKTINALPWARVKEKGTIEFFSAGYKKKDLKKKPALKLFNEHLKLGLLYAHPQMFLEEFSPYENFDGLILAGTGLGHFPITEMDSLTKEHLKIKESIVHLAGKMPVVMASQTIFGRVNMNIYSPGRELAKAGVLGSYSDLTPETAFIKLGWLLSNFPKEEVKKQWEKNWRGEKSERIEHQEDFL